MRINSLTSRMVLSIVGIVILSILVIAVNINKKLTETLRQEFIQEALNMVESTRSQVMSHYNSIHFHKKVMMEGRKTGLKSHMDLALVSVQLFYEATQRGELEESEAKRLAIDIVMNMRYDDGAGYFWIQDTLLPIPRMIAHPIISEFNNKIMDDPIFFRGKNGRNVASLATESALGNGDGYIEYLWPKPTTEDSEELPKLTYVRLFRPWNWIIASGIYIDDIDKDVQRRIDAVVGDLNASLATRRFGDNGFVYIANSDKKLLVHPFKAGDDVSEVINGVTGGVLIDEIAEKAVNREPYYEYIWQEPGEIVDKSMIREAWISYFYPLKWYIVCSSSPKDLELRTKEMTRGLAFQAGALLALALLVSLIIARSITLPMKRLVGAIQTTDEYGLPIISIPESGTSETRLLGKTINRMISSVGQSRKEVVESEAKFRNLVESSTDCIWETDIQGRYTYISPQIKSMTGYSPEDVVGSTAFELMVPDEKKKLGGIFSEILKKNEVFRYLESSYYHKDGRLVVMESNGVPVMDESGDVIGYRGITRNITDRKQIEERMKKLSSLKEGLLLPGALDEKMQRITDGIIDMLDVGAVRIWLAKQHSGREISGITCGRHNPDHIPGSESCHIRLIAKSGVKDNISVNRSLKCFEVEQVLSSDAPYFVTNDIAAPLSDFYSEERPVTEWTSYAGFRLKSQNGQSIGIMSIFSKGEITLSELTMLQAIAGSASEAIFSAMAEERLKESENRFRTLFNSSADGFFVIQGKTITDCNVKVCELTQFDKEEIIGNTPLFLSPEYQADGTRSEDLVGEPSRDVARSGKPQFLNWRIKRKDGTLFDSEVSLNLVEINGEPCIQGTMRDITERLKAEEELEHQRVDLERLTEELKKTNDNLVHHQNHLEELVADRTKELKRSMDDLERAQEYLVQSEKMAALGGLVAGVAHEINTPVGIGVTAASHLENETAKFSERYQSSQITRKEFENYVRVASESSKMILSNLHRAADLIQSFKRVAVDQSSQEKSTFKIHEYVNEILMSVNSKFKKTKHKINVDCPDDFSVLSYPGAISQILTNFLMNSLIHGFEGIDEGAIDIIIRKVGDMASIVFKDSGRGISEENLKKMFDPFFTTKRGQGGSGLGMHIVYNLVTQTLNGSVKVESKLGEGTRFEISFPADLKN